MVIDLLYFDGCPSWERGLDNLKAALAIENQTSEIHLIKIENEQQAVHEKFCGSPTFRVEGQDLWPEDCQSYQLACRIYRTEKGMKGYPSIEMMRSRLRSLLQVG